MTEERAELQGHGPRPTPCEHEASSGDRYCHDQYLGTDDDGREKWGRKCLICGEKVEFVFDYDLREVPQEGLSNE